MKTFTDTFVEWLIDLTPILMVIVGLTMIIVSSAQAKQLEPGLAPNLIEKVRVNDSVIRLSDLFEGAGDRSEAAVAYAPEPGKRAVFDAKWLYRIAHTYGLDWKPSSLKQRAVVVRESVVISREEIEDHILAALLDKGADPEMNVELSNRMLQLHVPGDSSAALAVEATSYDQRTQRFTAIVIAPADDPNPTRTRVTGRLHKMLEIPVLTRRILRGEVIGEHDIEWIKVRSKRLQRNAILDPEDLIGMTPKQGIRAGAPIRSGDVHPPILVKRNTLVTITLKTPLMTLTSQGRSLENGSEGDAIRVINTQSNKVIQATVSSAGQVVVLPIGLTAQEIAMN